MVKMGTGISRLALLAALGGMVWSETARAQDDAAEDLGTITLTASSTPLALSQTGASVDVVEGRDLDTAPLSFGNLLSQLPGVSVSSNGGLGTRSTIRLRGLPAYYTGTRIDGIDVSDPSGTQLEYDFGATTAAALSRVEVLRGSQSALYGSEAIGGVIDITSWRPETDGTSGAIALEGGSDATYSGSASVGFRDGRSELAFSMGRTVTDGFSAFAGGTEDDGFDTSFASLYAAHDLTEALRIGINGILRDSHADYDSATADADRWTEGQLRGGRVFAELETGAVSHQLAFARSTMARDVYEFGTHTYYDGTRDALSYAGHWAGTGALSVSWGLDRTKEGITVTRSWGSPTIGDSTTTSAWAEALYAPRDDLDLSLALRHDDHSSFGGKLTGRVAASWRPATDWTLRAVAATGFRAPSLYELHSIYGDPSFRPEESRSLELGVERSFGDSATLRLTGFDTRIKDRVIYDYASFDCVAGQTDDPFDPYDPYPGCYQQIAGQSRTRGIELSGELTVAPDWRLFGNYTYTDASADEGGARVRLAQAPRHDLLLGVAGDVTDRLGAHLSVRHVSGFLSPLAGSYPVTFTPMPDYTVTNAGVSYRISDTASAYLRVENLFDESYQTVDGYAQAGRQVFLGLRSTF